MPRWMAPGPSDAPPYPRQQQQEAAPFVLGDLTDAVFVLDRDWHITYVNEQAERLMRRARTELLGRNLWEEFPETAGCEFHHQLHRALAEQVTVCFAEYSPPFDTWFEVRAYPSAQGLSVFFRPLQEWRRAGQVVRGSEHFLSSVLDSLSAHVAVLDGSGRIVSVNAAWQRFAAGACGVGANYLAMTDAAAHAGEEYARAVARGIRDVLAGRQEHFELEYPNHGATERRWFLMRVTRFAGPGPLQVVVAHEDITARRKAEKAHRRLAREEAARGEAETARAHLHAVLERITDGFVAVDRQWRFTYVNRHAEAWFNRKREELLGRSMTDAIPGTEGSEIQALLHRAVDTQVPCEAEVPSITMPDRWLRLVAYPSPEGISIYFRDSTEQRRAEERLRFLTEVSTALVRSLEDADTLQAVTRLLVPTLADGCALVGDGTPEERVLAVAAAGRELEVSLREVLERPPSLAGPVGDAVEQARHTGEAVLLNGARLLAVPLRAHERTQGVLVLLRLSPGRHYGAEDAALARELARRTALALENTRLYRTARRAIALRDETLGIVSHDLVTPLCTINILCGTTELYLLPAGEAGQRAREHLRKIRQTVADMSRLLEELLSVNRLEEGRLSLDLEELEVPHLLSRVRDANAPLAAARSLHLEVEHEPGLPPVLADPARVLRVFQNLVDNAIKFTPPGGHIRLRAEAAGDHVRFRVSDTGRGIEPESLPYIFDRFWQASHASKAGAGLGLAITKGLIEAHGGNIQVESTVGKGTTFLFTLPMA
ncbi:PAS domain-containing protein [Archangium sp.]|uniref:sensor histidine kinase n=1 Tax=Archangium sp. TaxID=1872627 RepID=UPI002D79A936|nr:PAS domain-containing protein [Archangium sp.]